MSQGSLRWQSTYNRSQIEVQNLSMRFKWVPRYENNHADSLANLGAATEFQFIREILVEHIINPSLDTSLGWRDLIITRGGKGSSPWPIRMGINSIRNETLFT